MGTRRARFPGPSPRCHIQRGDRRRSCPDEVAAIAFPASRGTCSQHISFGSSRAPSSALFRTIIWSAWTHSGETGYLTSRCWAFVRDEHHGTYLNPSHSLRKIFAAALERDLLSRGAIVEGQVCHTGLRLHRGRSYDDDAFGRSWCQLDTVDVAWPRFLSYELTLSRGLPRVG